MTHCHDMRQDEIYYCADCGIELKVVKECKDVGKPAADCNCHPPMAPCTFACCGKDMVKR
jgi:hypothetical protein